MANDVGNELYNLDLNKPFDDDFNPRFITGSSLLEQQLRLLVTTRLGSLLWSLGWGSRMVQLIGEPIVERYYKVAEAMIKEAVFENTGYTVLEVVFSRNGGEVVAEILIQKKYDTEVVSIGLGV